MPDFLTRRNGTWHFARRVPTEFAHLDRRGVVRHSTKIRIASDRAAVRASRVAEKFNSSLKQHWRALADNDSRESVDSYNEARRRARQLGFDYIENAQLVAAPAAERNDLSNKTAEELRTEVLADIANMFPDLRLVPAKPRNSLAESKVRRLSWIAPQDACVVD